MRLKIVLILLSGSIFILLAGIFFENRAILVSGEVAYFSSALVVLASFKNYQIMVKRRLEVGGISQNQIDRDLIDKIEDPYELYSESNDKDEQKSSKELIQDEKKLLKKQRRSFSQTTKDTLPAFSFLRIGAYGLLVAGFFFLKSQHLFNIGSYLISLAIPIILILFILIQEEGKSSGV